MLMRDQIDRLRAEKEALLVELEKREQTLRELRDEIERKASKS
jgi:hypothetical protein